MQNIKRIQLLSDTETEDLYARPIFNSSEQALYFTPNEIGKASLERYYQTLTTLAGF